MVGLRGVAGGGSDAAVLFVDELLVCEVFLPAVAPLAASPLVEVLGKGLRQPVGDRLDHDRVVIVVVEIKLPREFVAADAGGDGKSPDVVDSPRVDRRDEV